MKTSLLDFQLITDDYPYELLLLADETRNAIDKYLSSSDVFLAKLNNDNVGVFCLYHQDSETVELKNIAVSEKYQRQGIGEQMITHIKKICYPKYKRIIVGTADCGINQIRFYERNGFQKYDVRKNFFIDNYPEPIFENGIQLKDMQLLKFEF
ncbi:GNAT family N-acetyltransferase [Soonwooa sp.]|uniref:GNAT family N-acetyltransferase n=1 Tax=Soonwooa sp. TaxID=1938592 RepID=UPI0035B16EC5